MAGAFRLYGGQWRGIVRSWLAQPLWRGVRTLTTRLMARVCGLGTGSPYGGAAMAGDRIASRVLALMGLSSAFPSMHSPYLVPVSTAAKLCGLFAGSLALLFAASLTSQDQRLFVSCRASGQSADVCLLRLSGR
jgi:hypothetical protein